MLRTNSAGKREQIIAAARVVVIRDGIWKTTTRKIAEEASITLASIHYHFESKETLLFAVFEEMLANIRGAALAHFAPPSPLHDRIKQSLMMTWEYSESHIPEQFLLSEMTLYALRTEGAAWLAQRQTEEFVLFYLEIFRGASDLAGHGNLDLEGLARFILAGIDGILLQHYADPVPARSWQAVRKLVHLAMRYPLTDGESPVTPLDLQRG
jgi:AcrR family transcriptional regulator